MNPYVTREQQLSASSAKTTHTTGSTLQNSGYRNIRFDIDVTAFSGTSITFTLEYYDIGKAAWRTLIATPAIAATGHFIVEAGIDCESFDSSFKESLKCVLPARVRLTPSGTITSVTYSIGATWSM